MVVKLIDFVWFLVKNRAHKESVEIAKHVYTNHVVIKRNRPVTGIFSCFSTRCCPIKTFSAHREIVRVISEAPHRQEQALATRTNDEKPWQVAEIGKPSVNLALLGLKEAR